MCKSPEFEPTGDLFLEDLVRQTSDFFRCQIEAALAPMFERKDRKGLTYTDVVLFGTQQVVVVGAGHSNAGRPRLPIRLMTSLLCQKHSFSRSR